MATDKIAVTIRIPEQLKEAASKAAVEDRRSLSVWIEIAIEKALKDRAKTGT